MLICRLRSFGSMKSQSKPLQRKATEIRTKNCNLKPDEQSEVEILRKPYANF